MCTSVKRISYGQLGSDLHCTLECDIDRLLRSVAGGGTKLF
jgi:hypothetical protein